MDKSCKWEIERDYLGDDNFFNTACLEAYVFDELSIEYLHSSNYNYCPNCGLPIKLKGKLIKNYIVKQEVL